MSFKDLGLSDEVLRAVSDAGYETPTPIQEKAIPYVLMNRDIMGCAQTGTGKTAGFTLPMIDILSHGRAKARLPRSLILEPTRELADQVAKNFEIYGKYQKLSKALLIGGVAFDEQFRLLDRGVDVLIATPGRLLDHFERGKVLLSDIKILVIDEADRMLDMGFIPDVERIVSLMPKIRQTLMFSATMPTEIRRLADQFLINPKEMAVDPPATAAELVEHALAIVAPRDKREALRNILRGEDIKNSLIFCNRKRDVGIVHRSLLRHGFEAGALHGDMEQWQRMETLESFKQGEIKFLVCSDVAARGLDIEAMSHVINFDVPSHAEDYIHRIGRTGRAGRTGQAITLATGEDARYLAAVERLLDFKIERIEIGSVQTSELEPVEDRKRSRRRGGRKQRSTAAPETPARKLAAPAETSAGAIPAPEPAAKPTEDDKPRRRSRGKKQTGKANEASGGKTNGSKDKSKAGSSKKQQPFGSDEDMPAFLRRPVRA